MHFESSPINKKRLSAAASISDWQRSRKHSSPFQDNRPEALTQRKLHDAMRYRPVIQRHVNRGVYRTSFRLFAPALRRNDPPHYREIRKLNKDEEVEVRTDQRGGSSFSISGIKTREHSWVYTQTDESGWVTDGDLIFVRNLAAAENQAPAPAPADQAGAPPAPPAGIRLLADIRQPSSDEYKSIDEKYNFTYGTTEEQLERYALNQRKNIADILENLSVQFPHIQDNVPILTDANKDGIINPHFQVCLTLYVGPTEAGHSIWIDFQSNLRSLLEDAYRAGYPIDQKACQDLIVQAATGKTLLESNGTGSSGHVENFRR